MRSRVNLLAEAQRHRGAGLRIGSNQRSGGLRRSWIINVLLGLLAFGAYLTETRFLAGIANNIGLFELITTLLLGTILILFYRYRVQVRLHRTIYLLFVLVAIVALSTVKLPPAGMNYGIVQLGIMVFGLLLTVALYNILSMDERYLDIFMRWIAYSAAVVALWVIIDQAASGGNYTVSGPFRNRSHCGIVMHTSFWLVLFFCFKTVKSKVERLFFLCIVLPMIFYCVAVSLRQSIYVALTLGVIGLLFGVFLAGPKKGSALVIPAIIVACMAFFLYSFVGDDWSAVRLFRNAADATSGEIEGYFTSGATLDRVESFSSVQRKGIWRALGDHPLIGVGWGGFAWSEYTPTGHEVHSTLFRFLAETGLIGFTVYLFFLLSLLWGGLKLWFISRRTNFNVSALVLLVGFCSLSVSHIYNRAITERTFWLFLAIFLAYDTLLHWKIGLLKSQRPIPADRKNTAATK